MQDFVPSVPIRLGTLHDVPYLHGIVTVGARFNAYGGKEKLQLLYAVGSTVNNNPLIRDLKESIYGIINTNGDMVSICSGKSDT